MRFVELARDRAADADRAARSSCGRWCSRCIGPDERARGTAACAAAARSRGGGRRRRMAGPSCRAPIRDSHAAKMLEVAKINGQVQAQSVEQIGEMVKPNPQETRRGPARHGSTSADDGRRSTRMADPPTASPVLIRDDRPAARRRASCSCSATSMAGRSGRCSTRTRSASSPAPWRSSASIDADDGRGADRRFRRHVSRRPAPSPAPSTAPSSCSRKILPPRPGRARSWTEIKGPAGRSMWQRLSHIDAGRARELPAQRISADRRRHPVAHPARPCRRVLAHPAGRLRRRRREPHAARWRRCRRKRSTTSRRRCAPSSSRPSAQTSRRDAARDRWRRSSTPSTGRPRSRFLSALDELEPGRRQAHPRADVHLRGPRQARSRQRADAHAAGRQATRSARALKGARRADARLLLLQHVEPRGQEPAGRHGRAWGRSASRRSTRRRTRWSVSPRISPTRARS